MIDNYGLQLEFVRGKASDAEGFIDVVQFEGDAVHLEGESPRVSWRPFGLRRVCALQPARATQPPTD